mmetsp:Transcript_29200/g.49296  ORF Transcript_29200/g.49296 Transcript_29200/m.49296 type:complete len:333 (-) Transcript_29200:58-1056(-)
MSNFMTRATAVFAKASQRANISKGGSLNLGELKTRGGGLQPPSHTTSLKQKQKQKQSSQNDDVTVSDFSKHTPLDDMFSANDDYEHDDMVVLKKEVTTEDNFNPDAVAVKDSNVGSTGVKESPVLKKTAQQGLSAKKSSSQKATESQQDCAVSKSIKKYQLLIAENRDEKGAKYVGEWSGIERRGQGKMVYASGATYEGGWENSLRHGKGVLTYPNGDKYDGMWLEGMQHGQGIFDSPATGVHYDGGWREGQLHGEGKLRFATGGQYEGEWQCGKMHGHGRYSGVVTDVTSSSAGLAGDTTASSSKLEWSEEEEEEDDMFPNVIAEFGEDFC